MNKKEGTFRKKIEYFIGTYKYATDSFVKNEAKDIVKLLVNVLNKINSNNKDIYIKMLKEVDLTVKEDIEKANIIELYLRNLNDVLIGNIEI